MNCTFQRTLRTASSERFVVLGGKKDVGAIDIHYLTDGRVAATVTLLDPSVKDKDIPGILAAIDEVLLPDVSLDAQNLVFTVVRGTVVGNFFAEGK